MIIKEKLDEAITAVRAQIAQDVRRDVAGVDFMDSEWSFDCLFVSCLDFVVLT